MRRVLKRLAAGLSFLIVLGLAMAAASPGHAESTLEQIKQRGKLLAGVRFDLPPNGFVDANGNNVGFGPDIAREMARHLGVEVEFIQTTSKTRIPLLIGGQIDAEFGATTPTKARDEAVDFSFAYNLEQAVILVRKGHATDPAAYFNGDKIVGSLQGSYFIDLWKQHSPNANIKEYQEFPELVVALAQGKVDVVPTVEFQARDLIGKLGERANDVVVGGVFSQDPQAIVLRENDSDLRDWVNWALQRMWADGTFQEIYKKHYHAIPPFQLGDGGRLQPGYDEVAKENDPW
jgi:polar amino acid transport system substrate-binding protein